METIIGKDKIGLDVNGEDGHMTIETRLRETLDNAKERVTKRNWDYVCIVAGIPGCQPKGSKVMMADGSFKNIEDVKVGDLVLSPQKDDRYTFAKVKNLKEFYSPKNFDVHQSKKDKKKLYSCSFNHFIPVNYKNFNKDRSYEWDRKDVVAEDLFEKSEEALKHNEICFSSPLIPSFNGRKNCSIEPYALGIFLGDGIFHSKRINREDGKGSKGFWLSRQIKITSADDEIIEEVSKYYPVMSTYQKKKSKAKEFIFSMEGEFAKELIKYGFEGKRSGEKLIPQQALMSDSNYRKRLLAGLIDSDGYYAKGGYEYLSKSKRLIENIRFLVYSLGGRCGEIRKVKKGIKKTGFVGEYYLVSFYVGGLDLPIITKRRRRDVDLGYKESNRRAVFLKESKPQKVYGFEIDSKSHWYITDNFMVTKNSGKSQLARHTIARYLCPWFDNSYTVFSADQFIEVTNNCPEHSAIVLDEAFDSLNSRKTMSKEFLKIVNHLQLLRQRHLFIILCLPNFFDLSKGVSIFRSSHLFVVYAHPKTGKRGGFLAFGRDTKRKLYIQGGKFLNYGAVRPNFVGEFRKNIKLLDDDEYEKMKMEHLLDQNKKLEKPTEARVDRANEIARNAIFNLRKRGYTQVEMEDILCISNSSIREHWKKLKEQGRVTTDIMTAMKANIKLNPELKKTL